MNRLDFIKISEWIEPNSKVLDLGCADGALLKYLQAEKMTAGYGIEISPANIEKGIKNKINIIQMNLEDGLSVFDNQFFDTVILSQTLQAMVNIEKIMDEMKRVAKNIIVSFPNFGYWKNRLQIINGKMPKSSDLPHEWYNTPNIHLCTVKDFYDLCEKKRLIIEDQLFLTQNQSIKYFSNLRGSIGIFKLSK
ncbi:methionine biosynthesis protein MetW [Methylophilales bacterium MBRSG12]|uniref:Methionine biosynthesis protein MetW n=1 Tax=Methylophilales bacterium MBRS-H7 TaxID=1623450 RepID=A0A0H4IY45_9PROT|nr:methionine biosynthesis protein MetW [Methylophilales bacterium MBRSF5]AKO65906.1 methionine biosynthesis protein MetW [Methylophilales bacterium MBRS-H7]AKO67226.1 methionine biosynthesis protein MetW [Methylophilales bacterium MBRSG12]